MDTIEVKGLTETLEDFLRKQGYGIEYLDKEYSNVISESKRTDDLTDSLDQWNLSWRLV